MATSLTCPLLPFTFSNLGRPRDFMLLLHRLSLFKLPVCSAEVLLRDTRTEMYFYRLILKMLCVTCIFALFGLFSPFPPTLSSPHSILNHWKIRYWICLIIGVWEYNIPDSKTHDLWLMHLHSFVPSELVFTSADDLQWWMTVKCVNKKLIKALWIQQGSSVQLSARQMLLLNPPDFKS